MRTRLMGVLLALALVVPVLAVLPVDVGGPIRLDRSMAWLYSFLPPQGMALKGVLRVKAVDPLGNVFATRQDHNLIPNAAETALRDCFGGTGSPTCTVIQAMKYHGLGTSTAAAAETDTGCTTELTTAYNPDGTRATGSQTNNGANIYRTVGTNTVDGSAAVTEFCLMSQATTGGTIWSRVVFSAINLSSGDSLQTTYDLTIE